MSRKRECSNLSWMATAEQLLIPYDYFDFAETNVGKKQRDINRWYYNTLYKALLDVEGANRLNVLTALNKFESRNNANTSFAEVYSNYWSSRDKSNSQERITNRQLKASELVNESACFAFESIILKVASTSVAANNTSCSDVQNAGERAVPKSSGSNSSEDVENNNA